MAIQEHDPLLSVEHLSLSFETTESSVVVLDDISLAIGKDEIVALVGESGCGKSVTAMSIMRLLHSPPAQYKGGNIYFQGEDLLKSSDRHLRDIRGNRISMIFQEPMTSLNPVLTIGDQVAESLTLHNKLTKEETLKAVVDLLEKVRIPGARQRLKSFPTQYSGGMRQRIMIAMAISCKPDLLIADEPTTALDVTIQAQILELLKTLKRETSMSILLITHDLGVVAEFSERIIVMYAGQIVESASTRELFKTPLHPYTQGLLNSLPKLHNLETRLKTIEGYVPSLGKLPVGCHFHPRCSHVMPICRESCPPIIEIKQGHTCRCFLQSEACV